MPQVPKLGLLSEAGREVGRRMNDGAQAGLQAADRDARLQVDVADDLTQRMQHAALQVTRDIKRGRIQAAAHAAGQVAMLARQMEIRLLGAVERVAGAKQVANAIAGAGPEPESNKAAVRREQQRARRARVTG